MRNENQHFEQVVENKPKKMTKARLHRLLEKLNLQYSIQGEPNEFTITIYLPQEHINEKQRLEQINVLNDAVDTKFDKEKFLPVLWAINHSANYRCEALLTDEEDKYIISVFKK